MTSYIDRRAKDGLNAFLLTARHGRVPMLELLQKEHERRGSQGHYLNPRGTKWSALHEAAMHGQ